MKNLILSLFLLLSGLTLSQTYVDIHVINADSTDTVGCPYYLGHTWAVWDSSFSGWLTLGNPYIISVESFGNHYIHHFLISDTTYPYPLQVSFCLMLGATEWPFPEQELNCIQVEIYGNYVDTLIMDCSILGVGLEELQNETELIGVYNTLGQPIDRRRGEILIFRYRDGSHKKVIIGD